MIHRNTPVSLIKAKLVTKNIMYNCCKFRVLNSSRTNYPKDIEDKISNNIIILNNNNLVYVTVAHRNNRSAKLQ